ncbi:hypothetical protein AKJ65_05815 [candidate division MSBL1 archaeon SCGC-AAA259E19]|uniref:Uncharacterized protein n=1 Tax=candidate division MSBL1 archaeon SCGC-AAA259E19 TaxID=1698264 RepID=A0A133UI22_9EURY|nr:hypothetical protein AKJ65_05815 [candidate division MSBL1 archaeon SCGC-AAA259E19]
MDGRGFSPLFAFFSLSNRLKEVITWLRPPMSGKGPCIPWKLRSRGDFNGVKFLALWIERKG